MAARIPDSHRDLLDRPIFVTLVTLMRDGSPQATPVWCSYDGTYVLVNSARGRQKDRNMERDPRVAILAIDPNNAYRWMEIRGTVEEITEQGALEHINALANKYAGREDYYAPMPERRGKERRVIYRIRPDKVNVSGK